MNNDAAEADNTQPARWTLPVKVIVSVLVLVLMGLGVYLFRAVLIPLTIGIMMAYVLQPVVRAIQRAARLPRGLATGLIYLALLVLVVPVAWSLTPVVVKQVVYIQRELIDFFNYLQSLSPGTTVEVMGVQFAVQDLVDEITSSLTSLIRSVAPGSFTFVFGAARTILLVVFTFVIGFYFTRDAGRIAEWLRGMIPPGYRRDSEKLLTEIDGVWSAFFRGQVVLALVVTVILTVLSTILGLPRPYLLGIWGGLLEFLPSIGNAIWGLTAVTVALLAGSSYLPLPNGIFALIVFGAYVAFAQVDINILIPNIIGQRVRLHPVVVIIGVIIGASVGGVLGVALAAPMIASVRILGRYVFANLFDLDPFPMVGPPAAPVEEREKTQAERLAAEAASTRPLAGAIAEKVRWRRRSVGTTGDDDAGTETSGD
jgi:predicted PurR-regulated permease PerM